MATLILTAVGTAIGGPIGGAIGALVGQRIDGEIFKPKGREGPRLVTTTADECPLDPGEAVADAVIEVRQLGTFGESPPARIILP